MSFPPEREKRKRRPSPPPINPMPYIIVMLLAFVITIGLAIFLVLTMQNRTALQVELDAQRLMLAVLSQTPNVSATPFPTQPPTFTSSPTFTPSPFPSATPLPIASPTPLPLQPVIPGEVIIFDPVNMLMDNGEPCFGHWVPAVWEELNVKPELQQAFAGFDFIQVEVFGQGYVCFDNNGSVNMGDSRTLHTDFYFIVDVETTDLVGVAPDLTDAADTPQRETLGSLARLILDRLEGFRGYEQPPAFSSVIHITFTSGEVFRTVHFTWANADEWGIDQFVAGAVTGLLGTGLGDLYTIGS